MRVGTITYHNANNYGAVLQAYALQKYLIESGVEAEIINYSPNPIENTTIQRSLMKRILNNLFKPNVYIENKIKQHRFSEFRKNNLEISLSNFRGDNEILNNPPAYDLYIVGSDQVWNTDISNKSKAYFLDFVKNGYRASYAASLGKSELNEVEKTYVNTCLHNFDFISVREESLKEKLKNEFSISTECVLDPVFLLDKNSWSDVASKTRLPKDYVLCYMLENSAELIQYTKDISKKLGCKPIFISLSNSTLNDKQLGPSEFIYTLANAKYICTNSFHGTAFSIIFNKKFTVFKHSKLNSRIESVVNIAGLNDRFYSGEINVNSIDYKDVNIRMENYINESKKFIGNVLKHVDSTKNSVIGDENKKWD